MTLIAYAGTRRPKPKPETSRQAKPNPADIQPIGMFGVAFLRRVKAAPDGYRICRRSDRMVFGRTLMAGLVATKPRHLDTAVLTPAGAAFLEKLMRVE